MSEKVYRFTSKWLGFTVWVGSQKVRFNRGIFETSDTKVADALRKHKECTEVTAKAEPAEASEKTAPANPAKATKVNDKKESAEASETVNS